MTQSAPTPESLVRSMQVITLAMVAGVVIFAVIALVLIGALSQPPGQQVVSLLAAALTAVAFVLHFVLPDRMSRQPPAQLRPPSEELRPYMQYLSRHVIRLALLEGPAFFNVIALVVEHHWWSLAIAGVLVGWMLASFPTRERVEQWIASRRHELSVTN